MICGRAAHSTARRPCLSFVLGEMPGTPVPGTTYTPNSSAVTNYETQTFSEYGTTDILRSIRDISE